MPNSALKAAIKEAYASVPTDRYVIETLELFHPSLVERIYLAKSREDLTLTLENSTVKVFTGCGFRLSLPATGDSGIQELAISFDNVDRRISTFIEQAKNFSAPVEVIYRPYLSTNLTTPQIDPPLRLFMRGIKVTIFEVSGRGSFADMRNKTWPNEKCTRLRFPSLGS